MTSVLAVDLGGTKTATAFVSAAGAIGAKQKTPAADTLAGSVEQIAARAQGAAIAAVGVIVPGIYNPQTGRAWAPNLWGWDEVPLRDALEQRLGIPAVIASDRTGYVLGESWLGVARGLSNVVFVAVGTGIGVGILAGGRVVEGARGIAGAAGWMAIDRAWKPEYAEKGCWESEAAGPAIARHAGAPNAELVFAAARTGNADALAVLRTHTDALAVGIANLISILDPEIVALGGGVMQNGDLLLDGIRAGVLRWAQPVAARDTRIELTILGEDAGLLGAARLALLSLHSNEKDNDVGTKILRTNS